MPDTVSQLVPAIQREIQQRVGKPRYELWFGPHATLNVEAESAVVAVPNRFFQEWLSRHFREAVAQAVQTVTGRSVTVRFEVDPGAASGSHSSDAPPSSAAAAQAEPQPPREHRLPPALPEPAGRQHWRAFDHFIVGPCNELAHAAARRALQPTPPWPLLLLHGPPGVGKTHLLQAACRELATLNRHAGVIYLKAEQFTTDFVTALRGGAMPSFRRRYRGVAALAVDDIQCLAQKSATQEEFLHTIDFLSAHGKWVLLAGDRPPQAMPFGSPALITRLQGGMTCKLDLPDAQTRRRLVQAKAESSRLKLDDAVVAYVADHVVGSVRELEGAVNTLSAHHELLGQSLSVEQARQALSDLVGLTARPVRLEEVEEAVCSVFGLSPKVLRSPVRHRAVSQPRTLAMYLARKHTRAAYNEIGEFFGGRNHSTVIAAQKQVSGWLDAKTVLDIRNNSWKVDDALSAIERALRAG